MSDAQIATENSNQDKESFDELERLFGAPEDELEKMEKTSLSEDLEGFANCFPSWDLHPPIKKTKR